VFAILTPGTGLFEAGAVVVIGLAAWRAVELSINVWALVVLALGLIPFIFAIRDKMRTLNLSLTLAALMIGSTFLFRAEEWWRPAVNPILVVITSVAAGGLLWLMTEKMLEAEHKTPSHSLEGLVGAVGEARTDISQEGSVYVRGEMWTAFSDTPIAEGSRVVVLDREGLLLRVKEIKELEA
jgi:membrane-bound serine protease (ClpP class)